MNVCYKCYNAIGEDEKLIYGNPKTAAHGSPNHYYHLECYQQVKTVSDKNKWIGIIIFTVIMVLVVAIVAIVEFTS